ncbi:MAG: MazG-like family protein [Oscillospiraceae bacterium]|nr:MazG-like family protein [Oscillospiraceae bacterium]
MDRLYKLAEGLNRRYPNGNAPYQIATRLAEECGEVASEVNHFEGSGIKHLKGAPSKENMAGELKNVMSCVMQLAIYYGVQEELERSIDASLNLLRSQGLID